MTSQLFIANCLGTFHLSLNKWRRDLALRFHGRRLLLFLSTRCLSLLSNLYQEFLNASLIFYGRVPRVLKRGKLYHAKAIYKYKMAIFFFLWKNFIARHNPNVIIITLSSKRKERKKGPYCSSFGRLFINFSHSRGAKVFTPFRGHPSSVWTMKNPTTFAPLPNCAR